MGKGQKIAMVIVVILVFVGVDWYLGRAAQGGGNLFRLFARVFFCLATLVFVAGIFLSFDKPPDPEEEKKQRIGNLFMGMRKEDLEDAGYTKERQLESRKEKDVDEEYISFIPLGARTYKKPITFYIRDGLVRKWDNETIEGLRGLIGAEKQAGRML